MIAAVTNPKFTRGSAAETASALAPAAYMPTQTQRGSQLYPPGKRIDMVIYIRSTEIVNDTLELGHAHSFTCFMNERDQERLDKTNAARAPLSWRYPRSGSWLHSAKAQGKESDVARYVSNYFLLIMAR